MKKMFLNLFLIVVIVGFVVVVSFILVDFFEKRLNDVEESLSNSYIEIDSDRQSDYELFIIPNDVDIFDLTDDDLEFYLVNTNDIDRYLVKLYEKNLVITVEDSGMIIRLYNQNGFYYFLVEKGEIK